MKLEARTTEELVDEAAIQKKLSSANEPAMTS